MVSLLSNKQITQTFKKRMELLGKPATISTGEPGEEVVKVETKTNGRKNEKWTREDIANQEYKALLSEGMALYRRGEYHRAIEAFTQATEKSNDRQNENILIDRADCYIKIGNPEKALLDVNQVLSDYSDKDKPNPRAILTKAEAYFSMGEFEFALVFFQKGLALRKDMSAFKDGVTKAKHAILDAINGKNLFQPNPNYAISRPRKPLVEIIERSLPKESDDNKQKDLAALLPEKVAPLSVTQEKQCFLGELSLDYDFLIELRSELSDPNRNELDDHGKKEDEEILKIVEDAIQYLDQRGAFWSQQGSKTLPQEMKEKTNKNSLTRTTESPTKKNKTAHYEMTKFQQYEGKYGNKEETIEKEK